jgi:hypothetical protein
MLFNGGLPCPFAQPGPQQIDRVHRRAVFAGWPHVRNLALPSQAIERTDQNADGRRGFPAAQGKPAVRRFQAGRLSALQRPRFLKLRFSAA